MSTARIASRFSLLAVTAATISIVAAAPSGASRTAYGPPASGPELSLAAFAVSDFSAARVKRQGYVKPDPDLGFIAEYDREFRLFSVTLGRKQLLGLEDDVGLARNTRAASQAVAFFRFAFGFGSHELRAQLARSFGVKPSAVKVGSPFKTGAGDESFAVRVQVRTKKGELDAVYAIVRVGPVDSLFYLAGAPKVKLGAADAKRLAKIAVWRTRRDLAPANTSLPSVSGVPHMGEFLEARPGSWRNASVGLEYQWERCDAGGAHCADLAGAISKEYQVSSNDYGQTLRIGVTVTNAYGRKFVESAPTLPISRVGEPVNTAPPTITGAALVGQTLTAEAGSWAGAPTSFGYQWRRCTSDGGDCEDIAGAVSPSYVVASGDVGTSLRVFVTATNASGVGSASSDPTALVP